MSHLYIPIYVMTRGRERSGKAEGRLGPHKYYLKRGKGAFDFQEEQCCFIVNEEYCF